MRTRKAPGRSTQGRPGAAVWGCASTGASTAQLAPGPVPVAPPRRASDTADPPARVPAPAPAGALHAPRLPPPYPNALPSTPGPSSPPRRPGAPHPGEARAAALPMAPDPGAPGAHLHRLGPTRPRGRARGRPGVCWRSTPGGQTLVLKALSLNPGSPGAKRLPPHMGHKIFFVRRRLPPDQIISSSHI